jgi:hypothetical protein
MSARGWSGRFHPSDGQVTLSARITSTAGMGADTGTDDAGCRPNRMLLVPQRHDSPLMNRGRRTGRGGWVGWGAQGSRASGHPVGCTIVQPCAGPPANTPESVAVRRALSVPRGTSAASPVGRAETREPRSRAPTGYRRMAGTLQAACGRCDTTRGDGCVRFGPPGPAAVLTASSSPASATSTHQAHEVSPYPPCVPRGTFTWLEGRAGTDTGGRVAGDAGPGLRRTPVGADAAGVDEIGADEIGPAALGQPDSLGPIAHVPDKPEVRGPTRMSQGAVSDRENCPPLRAPLGSRFGGSVGPGDLA